MKKNASTIITLITDFGIRDSYASIIKGSILNINPQANIVDISHSISPHNIEEAAYTLLSSYSSFPENTIHVIVVDPGVGSSRKILCISSDKYKFLAPDNGILSEIANIEKNAVIYDISDSGLTSQHISPTFHGRDIFAPIAAHLSLGTDIKNIGKQIKKIEKSNLLKIKNTDDSIKGKVIHIDNFGNLITNIHRTMLDAFLHKNNRIKITIKNNILYDINNTYSDTPKGKLLALFSSNGLVEISLNSQNCQQHLKSIIGDTITIQKI